MESLKIDLIDRIYDDKKKMKAVWDFNTLGFVTGCKSVDFYRYLYACFDTKNNFAGTLQFGNSAKTFEKSKFKEITLQQLKDLVVLKRNDVGDANAYCNDNGDYYYISCSGEYFYYLIGDESSKWMRSSNHISYLKSHVKPIEPKMSILDTGRLEMKEFLVEDIDGSYNLVVHSFKCCEEWIEVPAGADEYKANNVFYKNNSAAFFNGDCWEESIYSDFTVLWSRHTQPEALPFIDDEPITEDFIFNPSINDQYAEIKKVRQTAWDTQVGGNHYKQFKIQPMQFALENKLDAAQQNVIKYIMRHSFKNGKQDLEKAKHYIDLMIEFYYGNS